MRIKHGSKPQFLPVTGTGLFRGCLCLNGFISSAELLGTEGPIPKECNQLENLVALNIWKFFVSIIQQSLIKRIKHDSKHQFLSVTGLFRGCIFLNGLISSAELLGTEGLIPRDRNRLEKPCRT